MVCDSLIELKIVVRCVLVSCIEALTIEELWNRIEIIFGPNNIKLTLFGYNSFFEFLQNIPDVVQLEDSDDENSIVNLVSSEKSRHMEELVASNIIRPPSLKNKVSNTDLLVPYQTQCAFIRIFADLYPKGLSINDFESEVLCIPIFKSYIECIDALLYNLDHIFKKTGLETVCLQPVLVDNLKRVKEEGKFSAMDILNIDESSLENRNEDQCLADGLEYPLNYILEEFIKNNIELLLNEKLCWISERIISDLYISKFGSSFSHYRRWGFNRVSQMLSRLPELCCVHFTDNDVEIISAKQHSCDIYKNKDLKEISNDLKPRIYAKSIKEKNIENEPSINDGVLVQFLKNDPLLNASLDDCFLNEEITNVELKIGNSYNIRVCRVNSCFTPSLDCQYLDKSSEYKELIADMKKFYFINESDFAFDPIITIVNQTYAFFVNDCWFRGIVKDWTLNAIKIKDLDNGSLHTITHEDIRLLCKKFSQQPAYAFTCYLHGIGSIVEDELSKLVNQKCTINVVAIDEINKSVSVNIKLLDSASTEYLNDDWIKNGIADPDSTSEEE